MLTRFYRICRNSGVVAACVDVIGKIRWLFSDHGIQTGYSWYHAFQNALRSQRSEELLWRFYDSDLLQLRRAVDEEMERRLQSARLLGYDDRGRFPCV